MDPDPSSPLLASLMFEGSLIFLLILANGVFALSEMAIVSSRKSRLQRRADEGSQGAKIALQMSENPNRFLSTVQIGITSIGILAGVFGGAQIADKLAVALVELPWIGLYAEPISYAVVVLAITILSLIFGELVPKRLALSHPEAFAIWLSPPMHALSKLAAPMVWGLSHSTEFILRLLRVKPSTDSAVTEDEVKRMVAEGAQAGVFEHSEQQMIERVFHLDERPLHSLMTPRTEVEWLDIEDSPEQWFEIIRTTGFSTYPLAKGDLDEVVGTVTLKDVFRSKKTLNAETIQGLMRPALILPGALTGMEALEHFRKERCHVALVIGEYGDVQGLVTLHDVMEAIFGDMPMPGEAEDHELVRRADGSFLADGRLPLAQVCEQTNLPAPPEDEEGQAQTLGGLVMLELGRVPKSGDIVDWQSWKIEVMDMDGRRVDKVLLVPPKEEGEEESLPTVEAKAEAQDSNLENGELSKDSELAPVSESKSV